MLDQKQINEIKEAVEEFFNKTTMPISSLEISLSLEKNEKKDIQDGQEPINADREVINLDIKLDEPQILIGQGGQTLFEVQRLLRTVFNKRFGKIFYLNLDINDYKRKKIEYLKDIAKSLADQVALTKEEKELPPMSAYERRVIHAELSQRTDVITESKGDAFDRHIVIKPK